MKKERGSILVIIPVITLAIIGVGIVVYNKANSVISTTSTSMAQQEKEMYNAAIRRYYMGESTKGSNIKMMINEIIAQNEQYVGEEGRVISINVEGDFETYTDGDKLQSVCAQANTYEGGTNTQYNIDSAKEEMTNLSKSIPSSKNYKVRETVKDGIIYLVTIEEL